MTWPWPSWDEFVEYVRPKAVDSSGVHGLSISDTTLENADRLLKAVRELEDALHKLQDMGYRGNHYEAPPKDLDLANDAKGVVIEVIYSGEEILLHHRRLAKSEHAYGFLHEHDLLEHWDRYAGAGRIGREINRLVGAAADLLSGFTSLMAEDNRFLIDHLDLPPRLESDFRLSRNLFSMGFDEVGLLIAGRGLEHVLREIA